MKQLVILYLSLSLGLHVNAQVVISTDSLQVIGAENGNSSSNNEVGHLSIDTSYKTVYWVHGIAGNNQSWNAVMNRTENQNVTSISNYPTRKVYGFTPDYSGVENLNIFDCGRELNRQLNFFRLNPIYGSIPTDSCFVIAHSQGGLVSRAARYTSFQDSLQYPIIFKGLATFGSPHLGARIVNSSRNNGEVEMWINDGCKALAPAEIQIFLNSQWALNALISDSAIASFSAMACDELSALSFSLLVSSIRKDVSEDYQIGAVGIAKLDSFSTIDPIPVVTFYGVEEEPVLWRMLTSMTQTTKDYTSQGLTLNRDPFGINNDQGLPDYVNNKINNYKAKYQQNMAWARSNQHANFYSILSLNPYLFVTSHSQYFNALAEAKDYKNAYEWLERSNMAWKRHIGARWDTTYQNGFRCACMLDLGRDGYRYVDTIVQSPVDCYYENILACDIVPYIVHQILEEPSDGVVPVSSQRGYPGNKVGQKLLYNTNHMQERNSEETKRMLNLLFDGHFINQPIFKVPKK